MGRLDSVDIDYGGDYDVFEDLESQIRERERSYRKKLARAREVIDLDDMGSLNFDRDRFEQNRRVARLKGENGMPICDPEREAEMIEARVRENPDLPEGYVRERMALVLKYGKEIMQEEYGRIGLDEVSNRDSS